MPIDLDVPQDDDEGAPQSLPEGCGLPVAEGGGVLSPLSGAYLLIVLAEPISEQHKDKMLQKLRQGMKIFSFLNAKKSIYPIEECESRKLFKSIFTFEKKIWSSILVPKGMRPASNVNFQC